MQDIASKFAKVRPHAPESWSDADVRHLIHGVGGSPRRAKRLLKLDLDTAIELRDAYAKDFESGVHHTKAVIAAAHRYAAAFVNDTESEEPADEEPEAEPTPARTRRPIGELIAAVAG